MSILSAKGEGKKRMLFNLHHTWRTTAGDYYFYRCRVSPAIRDREILLVAFRWSASMQAKSPKTRQWRIYWKVMIMCTQKRWQICQCTQQEAMEKMYFSFDIISKLSTNFAQFIAVLQPETVVGLQFLFVCFHFGVDISSLINHTKKNSQKASFSAGTVCRDLNFRQFQRNEIALGTWRRFDQKL